MPPYDLPLSVVLKHVSLHVNTTNTKTGTDFTLCVTWFFRMVRASWICLKWCAWLKQDLCLHTQNRAPKSCLLLGCEQKNKIRQLKINDRVRKRGGGGWRERGRCLMTEEWGGGGWSYGSSHCSPSVFPLQSYQQSGAAGVSSPFLWTLFSFFEAETDTDELSRGGKAPLLDYHLPNKYNKLKGEKKFNEFISRRVWGDE